MGTTFQSCEVPSLPSIFVELPLLLCFPPGPLLHRDGQEKAGLSRTGPLLAHLCWRSPNHLSPVGNPIQAACRAKAMVLSSACAPWSLALQAPKYHTAVINHTPSSSTELGPNLLAAPESSPVTLLSPKH